MFMDIFCYLFFNEYKTEINPVLMYANNFDIFVLVNCMTSSYPQYWSVYNMVLYAEKIWQNMTNTMKGMKILNNQITDSITSFNLLICTWLLKKKSFNACDSVTNIKKKKSKESLFRKSSNHYLKCFVIILFD